MTTPYIGFGGDTLHDRPEAHAGDPIICPNCHQVHVLKAGKNDNGETTELLLFYTCKEKHYLAAVANRLIVGVEPDVRGEI